MPSEARLPVEVPVVVRIDWSEVRMSFRVLAMAVGAAWVVGAAGHLGVAAQGKTVWDGVFTAEQAKRGEAIYMSDCASCHGGDLGGDGFAPALSGAEFASAWNGLSLGDLLERVRISMPPTDPSAVSVEQKADILAHILQANKFPAGKTELPKEVEALKQITYKANK
jgi:mono/diheme cytochrome c family protein